MQYLLKVSLKDTPVWRLVAIDGIADRSFVAQLIALSFGYNKASRSFIIGDTTYPSGFNGDAQDVKELSLFDELNVDLGQKFWFKHDTQSDLIHKVEVMKKEDHLFCLMPSTLVGSGLIPQDLPFNLKSINNYFDKEDVPSLDLRECTKRMREFGSKRDNINAALQKVASKDLSFKVSN